MLRRSVIILSLVFSAFTVQAKCAYNGIHSVQHAGALDVNSIFILEFYGKSLELVNGLGKKYPVFLQHGQDRVELAVSEVLYGEFSLAQVIFKPAGLLEPGKTYELIMTGLPDYERSPSRFNEEKEKWEPVSYFIENKKVVTSPVILHAVESGKSHQEYGCGPAISVQFSISGKALENTFARTTVKNLSTGKITTYLLPVKDGVISVGHGMCSGAFVFNEKDCYEVSFAPIDHAGKTSEATKALTFYPPIHGSINSK